jgi:uncharacterized protein (TIGR02246 family)
MAPPDQPRAAADEAAVRRLFLALHAAWNARDARAFASLFTRDGWALGFDGSLHADPASMERDLAGIFASHATASYVARVRFVRFPAPATAVLLAATSLVPPGGSDITPAVNAFQVIVACRDGDGWRIASLQNTPAAFHGRPELIDEMNAELRAVLHGEDGNAL